MLKVSDQDKQLLLELTQQALRAKLQNSSVDINHATYSDACRQVCGVFVTLRLAGNLRGCIGSVYGSKPLCEELAEVACKAAFADPRFPPLTAQEMSRLDIKVSLLSQPRQVESLDQIELGRHGLILRKPPFFGLFLPEVAREQGWDLDNYLKELAKKSGIETGDWQGGELYSFTTTSFP